MKLCNLKIDVLCEASVNFQHISQNAAPATEFFTLSPLRAALTMRFAKTKQHDSSKVLRLPRKMELIFWKRRNSIAPATQKGFPHVTKHVWISRSATPVTRKQRDVWNLQKWPLLQNLP